MSHVSHMIIWDNTIALLTLRITVNVLAKDSEVWKTLKCFVGTLGWGAPPLVLSPCISFPRLGVSYPCGKTGMLAASSCSGSCLNSWNWVFPLKPTHIHTPFPFSVPCLLHSAGSAQRWGTEGTLARVHFVLHILRYLPVWYWCRAPGTPALAPLQPFMRGYKILSISHCSCIPPIYRQCPSSSHRGQLYEEEQIKSLHCEKCQYLHSLS